MTAISPTTKIVLITGANKGIGYTTAELLLRQTPPGAYHVLLCSRSAERGNAAVQSLHAKGLTSVSPLELDVTSDASIIAAAAKVRSQIGRVDILVNNAGISIEYSSEGVPLRQIYHTLFDTNLFGAAVVTDTFLPLLEKSAAPHLIFQSSDLASLTRNTDPEELNYNVPFPVYRASKAGMNMLALHYAKVLKGEEEGKGKNWRVNIVNPGYTATDLNNHSGPKSVEDGSRAGVRLIVSGDGKEEEEVWKGTGRFLEDEGVIPW